MEGKSEMVEVQGAFKGARSVQRCQESSKVPGEFKGARRVQRCQESSKVPGEFKGARRVQRCQESSGLHLHEQLFCLMTFYKYIL
ncbi:hypothetical protein BgiBS90_011023 [Biomphalaria glabrata]|nr:hypothetical protein BgiMline_023232 [Biomphalaria glabrata]KAI8788355.1 hypothetical protein BgiBS90_011023 [Biomphalaria glabrata]